MYVCIIVVCVGKRGSLVGVRKKKMMITLLFSFPLFLAESPCLNPFQVIVTRSVLKEYYKEKNSFCLVLHSP